MRNPISAKNLQALLVPEYHQEEDHKLYLVDFYIYTLPLIFLKDLISKLINKIKKERDNKNRRFFIQDYLYNFVISIVCLYNKSNQ